MAADPVQRLRLTEFGANACRENAYPQNRRRKRSEEDGNPAIPECPPPTPHSRQDDREADAPVDDRGGERRELKLQVSFGHAEGNHQQQRSDGADNRPEPHNPARGRSPPGAI